MAGDPAVDDLPAGPLNTGPLGLGTLLSTDIAAVPVAVVRPLRLAVLRPGGAPPDVVWAGDDDAETVHLAARSEAGVVVGVATLLRRPWPPDPAQPAWRLRGMATAGHVRGTGIGSALLAVMAARVATGGGGVLWCHARLPAVGFYSRAGFTPYGEAWDDPELGPHVRMFARSPQSKRDRKRQPSA